MPSPKNAGPTSTARTIHCTPATPAPANTPLTRFAATAAPGASRGQRSETSVWWIPQIACAEVAMTNWRSSGTIGQAESVVTA
ncbi:unnamed protein product [Periconia digitata]|uniref:Uncharacterized protein n=1 Tax=Periconia digitata TaxID=1303443 RepID=A0A9W4UTV2_9PLEO|nr:unnamed protein product [Periconia digitata]